MLLTINSCCGERLSGHINGQRGPRWGGGLLLLDVTAPVLATNLGSSSLGVHQPETAGTTGTIYNEQLKAKTSLSNDSSGSHQNLNTHTHLCHEEDMDLCPEKPSLSHHTICPPREQFRTSVTNQFILGLAWMGGGGVS